MQKRIQQIAAILFIVIGLALSFYGLLAIFSLDSFAFGKFATSARDTSSAILVLLIGVALALFGWFSGAHKDGNATGQ